MKITSTLSVATLAVAGLFATGCSQQQVGADVSQVAGSTQQVAGSSQQVAGSQQVQTAPEKVAPAPAKDPNAHTHPAIPNCTDSITHSHPNGSKPHHHRYACKGQQQQQKPKQTNKWAHTHPAVPNCTNSITHTHKYQNRNHTHKYSCKGMHKGGPDIFALQRKLKAKGYYKGPINGVVTPQTREALQRFMRR